MTETKNVYAEILEGPGEGLTVYVKRYDKASGEILVLLNSERTTYKPGEYQLVNVYPEAAQEGVN